MATATGSSQPNNIGRQVRNGGGFGMMICIQYTGTKGI
jgi:hypothetical protein